MLSRIKESSPGIERQSTSKETLSALSKRQSQDMRKEQVSDEGMMHDGVA